MRFHSLPLLLPLLVLGQDSPDSVRQPDKRFRKSVVVSGLANPWELAWGSDGMLWTTERSGKRVTRVNPATGERRVAITLNEVAAPGGQDGLMGMALDLANNHVYVAYTYVDKTKSPDLRVADPASPYRFLYGKIVRLTWNAATQTLANPVDLITGLPAGNDHNAYRLKLGPDRKLYFTIGDQGNNQLGNFCHPVLSQRLPTAAELAAKDYAAYEGKSMRLELNGAIPADNPEFGGVRSHLWTVGHRNTQGIDFGPDGTLYAAEHGPKTDDEVNILKKGGNYGWPHVAGLRDGNAYEFARWADAKTPCNQLRFSDLAIHPDVPREPESAFQDPAFVEPIATMFTVPTGYNFENPVCKGIHYICWPTVGISSMQYYGGGAIPGWDRMLFITTLKRGSIYVLPLDETGQKAAGKMFRYFYSENRYRDTAISPDGKTIYVATDSSGLTEARKGGVTTKMQDPGAILAFTYVGEGAPGPEEQFPLISEAPRRATPAPGVAAAPIAGDPPQFTAKQVADGKKAYNSYCAVCHGSTLTNGTFGTPLGGEYFREKWLGKTVGAFYDKSRKTMPPASPGSLPAARYADVVAYILEMNGYTAGPTALPAGGAALEAMRIK